MPFWKRQQPERQRKTAADGNEWKEELTWIKTECVLSWVAEMMKKICYAPLKGNVIYDALIII